MAAQTECRHGSYNERWDKPERYGDSVVCSIITQIVV